MKNFAMALAVALLLCPIIIASDILLLKKDNAKTHCNNIRLNVLNNAHLAVYQAALPRH